MARNVTMIMNIPLTMMVAAFNRAIINTALLGILVSTYALYVEMAAEARPGYKALCDISEHASCSRVLTSKFSKGFGIVPEDTALEVPNCIYGILFYCIIIFLATCDNALAIRLQLVLSIASVASAVYLAYLLIFVLHDLCIVCVFTYFINGYLLFTIFKKYHLLINKLK